MEDMQTEEVILLGADAVALYPSLDKVVTAEEVRKEVTESRVKWEGVNWGEVGKYVTLNTNKGERRQMGVDELVPTRRFSKGPTPQITGEDAKSKHGTGGDAEAKWIFLKKPFSDREQAKLMGALIKVGTDALFNNHTYQCCENLYLQINGGPTGLRYTGLAARVRMTRWARKLVRRLKEMGIEVVMIYIYVDDVRIVCRALREDVKYCEVCKSLYRAEGVSDNPAGESSTQRTARLLGMVMNTIERDLEFTTETAEDFPSLMLPTLDYQIWREEEVITQNLDP